MLGAVMLNALQGKVSDPTASIAEPDTFISTETVSLFDVPWMLKTPVTGTCTTDPVRAPEGSFTGVDSMNLAVGYRSLSRPMVWIFSSRSDLSLLRALT